jgi:hypothetical protein
MGVERLKIALQAILAKAPDCRIDLRSFWPLPPWGKSRSLSGGQGVTDEKNHITKTSAFIFCYIYFELRINKTAI